MQNLTQSCVGVDISKKNLDIFYNQESKFQQIENCAKDIKKFVRFIKKNNIGMVLCEASGGYETAMVRILIENDVKVYVVTANRIRHYAGAIGLKAKTDPIDAKLIARFGASDCFTKNPPQVVTKESLKLRELASRKSSLKKMLFMEKSRLSGPSFTNVTSSMKRIICALEKEIKKIDAKINEQIKTNPIAKKTIEIVRSMPGVGHETAQAIAATLPEIGMIESSKLSALVGVAPFTKQSGEHKGISRVSGGRSQLRKIFYMAALVATRHNPKLRVFYNRLRDNGKPAKVALVAVMRKMIVILNVMVKRGEVWKLNEV